MWIAFNQVFLKNTAESTLVVNCVDFSIELASSLLNQQIDKTKTIKVLFTKTQLSTLGVISQEQKACYLKTIRYYIGLKIRELSKSSLIIADIDALFTRSTFDRDYRDQFLAISALASVQPMTF